MKNALKIASDRFALFSGKLEKMLDGNGVKIDWLFIVGLVLLGSFWFFIAYQRYDQFAFRTGDTAVAEQAIWNTIHGRIFYQSFLGTETNLREHLNFVQLLYVPFYAVVPHTVTLLLVIQVGFLLGAFALYRFATRTVGRSGALLAVALFLFHPLTGSQAASDMHAVAVAGPMFLMLLMAYHEKRYRAFLIWTVGMVFVSEFVAPTVFLVAVLALIDRRGWKWTLPPAILGIGLYMMAKAYITIGFSSHEGLISKFRPEALLAIKKIGKRMDLVSESIAPLLWIFPWFSKYSILLIPSILIALVVIIPERIGGGNHVFILIPPVLAMIFIDLVERFPTFQRWIFMIAFAGILMGLPSWINWMDIDGSDLTEGMKRAEVMIKDGGSLTSSSQFGAHLNRREEFFLPMNEKLTDYVVLKLSKNREGGSNLEQKYSARIASSGLYREIFRESRIVVLVKKEKISELSGISISELDSMSDEDLQKLWNDIPSE